MLKKIYYWIIKTLKLKSSYEIEQLVNSRYEDLMNVLLQQRHAIRFSNQSVMKEASPADLNPLTKDNLKESLTKIKKIAPSAYQAWEKCQKEGIKSYVGFPADSCSVDDHFLAQRFHYFLMPYLHGAVLDIGCGPQPVPSYLMGYPSHLVAGIDPIDENHPFVFCKGIAEFLPWKDNTFDVVIIATSLDHTILLDKVLEEIHRVLRIGGTFLLWSGFVEDTIEYNPYQAQVFPVDEYHLFYLSQPWFEKITKKYFNILEKLGPIIPNKSGESFFYAFSK